MNPEYLQALGTLVVAIACHVSVMTELISPNFEAMSSEEMNKAIAVYDEMIRLNPENANAYSRRGAAWMAKKEFDKAISDFDRVIRLAPTSAKLLAERLNDRDGRVRLCVAEVLIRYPDWANLALNTILECLADKDDDIRWYAAYSLAEVAPESPEVVKALLKAAHDPVSKVRVGAVYALGEIGPYAKDASDELRQLLKSTNDPELKQVIQHTLIQLDSQSQ